MLVASGSSDGSDRLTDRSEVQGRMEPVDALAENPRHPFLLCITRGETRPFRFRLLRPIAEARWTVHAEGVAEVLKGTINLNDASPARDAGPGKAPNP